MDTESSNNLSTSGLHLNIDFTTVDAIGQNNLEPGEYLRISITTDKDALSCLISKERFNSLIDNSVSPKNDFAQPSVPTPSFSTKFTHEEIGIHINTKDYKPLFEAIRNEISFEDNCNINYIEICSTEHSLLELPWNFFLGRQVAVFRKIKRIKVNNDHYTVNRFAIIISHAHKEIGSSLDEGIKNEVKQIMANLLPTQGGFRVESFSVLKHTNQTNFKHITWPDYNFLHLAMHGSAEGALYFEKEGSHKHKDPFSFTKEEFVDALSGSNFRLVFLACCYSGGGLSLKNQDSLAFKLVKAGIAKYAIGYHGKAGHSLAEKFSNRFYGILVSCNDIKQAYKEAFVKYMDSSSNYLPPLLYM